MRLVLQVVVLQVDASGTLQSVGCHQLVQLAGPRLGKRAILLNSLLGKLLNLLAGENGSDLRNVEPVSLHDRLAPRINRN